jgi:hypothetical protein
VQVDGVSVTVRFTGAVPSITTVAETVALNVVDAAARTAAVLMTLFEPSQNVPDFAVDIIVPSASRNRVGNCFA